MLMHRVRVNDHKVAGPPVIALSVVYLVATALKDVQERFVLMGVPLIRAAGEELHGVELDRLGQEEVIARPHEPLRARAVREALVCRVAGAHDQAAIAHARRSPLLGALRVEAVALARKAAHEHALAGHRGERMMVLASCPGHSGS